MSRKTVASMLALCMALSMAGCAQKPAEEPEVPATTYTAGTYTATATGMKGDVTVEVTFDEKGMTAASVKEQAETFGIGYGMENTPVEAIPAAVVANQSLAVDNVTGATITTAAVKTAIADTITQAGGDAEAWKNTPVEKEETADETYDVDIVVVGAGAAGLSAAISAKDAGADVLVLEKQSITGGSTARSGGKVLAAGTDFITELGQDNDPELLYDYLMETGKDYINEDLLKPFVMDSAANLDWMSEQGVVFEDVEAVHSNLPIWWVHNTEGKSGMTDGHGGLISVPMTKTLNEKGGKILYNTPATELIVTDGAVSGVKSVRADGTTVTVNADSVILCTGGYAQNREMLARIPGDEGYFSSVPAGNVGDGIVMAEAVGAKVYESPSAAPVFIDLTCGVGGGENGGLMVSSTGERIVNEYTYQFHTGRAIEATGTPYGYYIATANDPNPTVQYGMTLEKTAQAATVEELAEKIGMDPATLKATVDRYNELCAKGVDDDFGKKADHLWPIEGDMIYAFKMVPIVSFTLGGLCLDTEAHVLDANDQPIKGLYAAGEVAFTGLIGDDYPSCGMAIGASVYYARQAAATAVAESK